MGGNPERDSIFPDYGLLEESYNGALTVLLEVFD